MCLSFICDLVNKYILNSTELKSTQNIKLYHFVHAILSVPFCPIPFCPCTILSIPFCPYHFVRTILSATILSGHLFEFCWSSFASLTCSRVMASPVLEQELTLEDVLELSADEPRDELTGREIDPNGMSKV